MISVYNNFDMAGAVTRVTALDWPREYAGVSQVTLTAPNAAEHFDLLMQGNVLYKRDTDDAAIIKNKRLTRLKGGVERLVIEAYSPEFILSGRTVSYSGGGDLSGVVNALLTQSITAPEKAVRRIPNFRIMPHRIGNIDAGQITIENENLLEMITLLTQRHGVGFKVRYNFAEKTWDFHLYQGRPDTGVIFSRQFNNVVEQDYYSEESEYKNTALVGEEWVNDNNAGLDRWELFVYPNNDGTGAQEQGRLALMDYRKREAFDTVIDAKSEQYVYLKDWDIGDIVLCREERWGVRLERRVSSVTEYSDRDGKHLSAVFGDPIPTLNDRLARMMKGK